MSDFKFPDEQDELKNELKDDDLDDEIIVEVEDKTPPEDRNKAPLPEKIKEELYNDELEDYSTKVKKKLLQMKKLAHDERREKETALREQNETVEFAKRLMDENKRLKSNLSNSEKNVLYSVTKTVEMELEQAKKAYREAYDSGDTDKLVDAQQALMDASLKLDRTRNFKPTLQDDETEVQLPQRSQADNKTQPVDPKFTDWQRRNSNWFQKDEEMTDAAMGLHKKLYREYGPEYIGTDDYYERIDKTIRKRFPESFPENRDVETRPQQKSKPSTVVASARRSTAPKSIKLTQTQAALEKKFKLTPEQYAREVLKLENR